MTAADALMAIFGYKRKAVVCDKVLTDFAASQQPLGRDFQKVLDDNLSELLARWGDIVAVQCEVCGETHPSDNIPFNCENGDGE